MCLIKGLFFLSTQNFILQNTIWGPTELECIKFFVVENEKLAFMCVTVSCHNGKKRINTAKQFSQSKMNTELDD